MTGFTASTKSARFAATLAFCILAVGPKIFAAAPSFASAVTYSTNGNDVINYNQPRQVAIADLSGDGNADIVVPNWCDAPHLFGCLNDGTVSVFMGNGDGTFQAATTYNTNAYFAISVAVTDVNRDGKPDVIVAEGCGSVSGTCPATGTVSVLLGNGDGTLQPAQNADTGGLALFMTVADVNRDGKPDVIVANMNGGSNGQGSVGVLLGNGDGTFQPVQLYSSGGAANFVVVADVNRDSKPDILVSNGISATIGVLIGNGRGAFSTALTYPVIVGASAIIPADLNNDGKIDLVLNGGGAFDGGIFGTVIGNGDGTFQAPNVYPSGGAYNNMPVIADLNRDHKLDVVVPNLGTCPGLSNVNEGCVAVFLGNGDGTLQPPVIYDTGGSLAMSVVAKDLNGDGMIDLAAVHICSDNCSKPSVIGVLQGNGDGTFGPAQTYATGSTQSAWLAAGDLNHDRKPDLLVESSNVISGTISVLLNTTP